MLFIPATDQAPSFPSLVAVVGTLASFEKYPAGYLQDLA